MLSIPGNYDLCVFFHTLILDPYGGLKYSIKMLSREADTIKSFTNPNGRTIYGECENDKCIYENVPFFEDESFFPNEDEKRL